MGWVHAQTPTAISPSPETGSLMSHDNHKTRFVLHIGTHKTGTSAIQAALYTDRERLAACGILYPETGRPEKRTGAHTGHHELAWCLTGKLGYTDFSLWRDLLAEVRAKDPRVAVLSSEYFWLLDTANIERIAGHLECYSVSILLYLRNQFTFMVSLHGQGIKSGNVSQPFSQFIADRLWYCEYAKIIERWSSVFGNDSIIIRLYDREKKHLFAGVSGALDCQLCVGSQKGEKRVNASPPNSALHMIRLLNHIQQKGQRSNGGILHRVRRNLATQRRYGKAICRLMSPFLRKPLYTDRDRAWLREATREHNKRFLKEYIGTNDWEIFEF